MTDRRVAQHRPEDTLAVLRQRVEVAAADPDWQWTWVVENGYPVGEIFDQLADIVPGWFGYLEEADLLDDSAERALMSVIDGLQQMEDSGRLLDERRTLDRPEWREVRALAQRALALLRV